MALKFEADYKPDSSLPPSQMKKVKGVLFAPSRHNEWLTHTTYMYHSLSLT